MKLFSSLATFSLGAILMTQTGLGGPGRRHRPSDRSRRFAPFLPKINKDP